jgi:hypothetical protein
MTIHHATLKRAEKLGVVLTEPKEGVVLAHWPKLNQRLSRANAKEALDEMEALIELKTSFKSFKLNDAQTDDTPTFTIVFKGKLIGNAGTIREAFAQARAEWKERQQEAEENGEEIEDADDEEIGSGSCVPEKYKRLYAERGDARCCGDWLAETLNELVLNGDGKLDVEALCTVAEANGVQCRQYANSQTPGWQGRMRMTTRNMLRGKVALAGVLTVPGGRDRKAPNDWCQDNMPKAKVPKKKAA